MNVRQNTALGDCDTAKEFVELLIVSYGQLNVTRDDASLLVVACCVSGELEDFSGEILKNGGQVDRCACSNTRCVFPFLEESTHSSDWKLKSCLR